MQYRPDQPYLHALTQTPTRKVSWSKRRQKTLASRIPPSASDVSQSPPPTPEAPPVFPRLASLVSIGDRTPEEVHTCTRMLRLIHELHHSDLPSDRVLSTREALADDTYENALKIEIAVDRLLADLDTLPDPLPNPLPILPPITSHPTSPSLKPHTPATPTPPTPPTPRLELFTSPKRRGLPLPPHSFSF